MEGTVAFDYDGELVTVGGERGKFLCTSDHRWPVVSDKMVNWVRGNESRKVVRAHELKTSHRIPRAARCDFVGSDDTITERHAALIGWLFTDGYLRWRGNCPEAVFYQKKAEGLAQLRRLIGDDAGREYVHPQTGVIQLAVKVRLTKTLVALCRSKQDLPLFVSKLNARAAKAMWDAMMPVSYTHLTLPTNREV